VNQTQPSSKALGQWLVDAISSVHSTRVLVESKGADSPR
jgi:hypothetical protein